MDRNQRKLETLRKRNDELTSKLEEANDKLVELQYGTEESYEKARKLITDLTVLKYDWTKALLEVQQAKLEYDRLIEDVKILKKGVKREQCSSKILNMMGLN